MFSKVSLVLLLVLSGAEALACSCMGIPYTAEGVIEMAEGADLVFLGTVIEVNGNESTNEGAPARQLMASTHVDEAFRGVTSPSAVELWTDTETTCAASFKIGVTYLFFAYLDADYGRPLVSLCSSDVYDPSGTSADISERQNHLVLQAVSTLRATYR